MNEKENYVLIDCIGADGVLHKCYAHSKLCKCGMKIKRKYLLREDHKRFSCYECTY